MMGATGSDLAQIVTESLLEKSKTDPNLKLEAEPRLYLSRNKVIEGPLEEWRPLTSIV